jgi:hypothetical protein
MRTLVMRCDACGVEVRGDFSETLFGRLPAEDLECLEQYLLAGFSIKALAASSGMGYTVIRAKLDRLIERCTQLRDEEIGTRRILARLSEGEITATEAARLISANDNSPEGVEERGR